MRKIILVALIIWIPVPSLGQSGGGFDLSHNVIASGGETSTGMRSGTTFSVEGTIGQGVAGTTSTSSSSTFSVRGGFWAFQPLAPTAAGVSVGGRVMTAAGMPIGNVRISLTGANTARIALSNPFGYYRFQDVEVGNTYLIEASSKRFEFIPRTISIKDELTDVDLVALP